MDAECYGSINDFVSLVEFPDGILAAPRRPGRPTRSTTRAREDASAAAYWNVSGRIARFCRRHFIQPQIVSGTATASEHGMKACALSRRLATQCLITAAPQSSFSRTGRCGWLNAPAEGPPWRWAFAPPKPVPQRRAHIRTAYWSESWYFPATDCLIYPFLSNSGATAAPQ